MPRSTICLLLLLTTSASVGAELPNTLPNVLLIVSDDQRPDTISALGNSVIKTPHLDALVRSGTSLTRATCANPICTPSRAEILTGCTGIRNGVFDFGRTISDSVPRLPNPFAEAGYLTWYCGKWHNNGRPKDHGYARTSRLFTGGGGKWAKPRTDYRGTPITGYKGWIFRDESDKPLPDLGVGLTPDTSERIADGAIAAIRQSGDKPFFVHVNFTAPHDPLLPHSDFAKLYSADEIPLPKNFAADHPFDHGNRGGRDEVLLPIPRTKADVRADIAAYYAVISHMDAQVGRILDAVQQRGLMKNTIVAFTSDHGLAVGSHGLRGKQNMYEHTIGVPMIFAGPGVPKDKRVNGQAYLRDLFPTLCGLVGLDHRSVDGRSQVPVIRGERQSMYEYVYGYFRNSQRMIRSDRWKYIHYPLVDQEQLFDLEIDPYEQKNLASQVKFDSMKTKLRLQLDDWIRKQKQPR